MQNSNEILKFERTFISNEQLNGILRVDADIYQIVIYSLNISYKLCA